MISRRRLKKILSGWLGGLLVFIVTVGAGIMIVQSFPVDPIYTLSIDFVSFRKLEYFARSDKEFSTPLMDVSELDAKMEIGNQISEIKISSMHEPYSDIGKNLLSFFVISEDDTNPYILLSLTPYSKSYVSIISQLDPSLDKKSVGPKLIRMKINGLTESSYYKIDLPSNEELDSLILSDAIQDADFSNFERNWNAVLQPNQLPEMRKWASEVLVYYSKDNDGVTRFSHFLPLVLREFYE